MIKKIELLLRKVFGLRLALCIKEYCRHIHHTNNRAFKLLLLIANMPLAVFEYCSKKVIPYTFMDVTSKCSLNCKECSHLMPYYRSRGIAQDYAVNDLLENIELFLPHIDRCLRFGLMGGEAFLHKELYKVIDRLAAEKKIKHVQIVTNGTIVPAGENLRALQQKKVTVHISNYGALSKKSTELIRTLKEHKVPVSMSRFHPVWVEMGGLKKRNYTEAHMRQKFGRCSTVGCKGLFGGKLWLCNVAYHSFKLELTPENKKEYIDLRACTNAEFWDNIKRLYNNPEGLSTCYYCPSGDSSAKEVPSAQQAE